MVTGRKRLFIIVSKNSPKGDKAGFREQNLDFIDEDYIIWNNRVCQQNSGCKCGGVSGSAGPRQGHPSAELHPNREFH